MVPIWLCSLLVNPNLPRIRNQIRMGFPLQAVTGSIVINCWTSHETDTYMRQCKKKTWKREFFESSSVVLLFSLTGKFWNESKQEILFLGSCLFNTENYSGQYKLPTEQHFCAVVRHFNKLQFSSRVMWWHEKLSKRSFIILSSCKEVTEINCFTFKIISFSIWTRVS